MDLKLIYDWFVQIGKKWNMFIHDQPENLQQAAQKFKDDFVSEGYVCSVLILIVCSIIISLLYYGPYNNLPGFRYRKSHWFISMLINAVCVFIITCITVSVFVESSFIYKTWYLTKLAFLNSVYSGLLYIGIAVFVAFAIPKKTNANKLF